MDQKRGKIAAVSPRPRKIFRGGPAAQALALGLVLGPKLQALAQRTRPGQIPNKTMIPKVGRNSRRLAKWVARGKRIY